MACLHRLLRFPSAPSVDGNPSAPATARTVPPATARTVPPATARTCPPATARTAHPPPCRRRSSDSCPSARSLTQPLCLAHHHPPHYSRTPSPLVRTVAHRRTVCVLEVSAAAACASARTPRRTPSTTSSARCAWSTRRCSGLAFALSALRVEYTQRHRGAEVFGAVTDAPLHSLR